MRDSMFIATVAAFSSNTETSRVKRARERTLVSFTKVAIIVPHFIKE
jgi:hypothetical protein